MRCDIELFDGGRCKAKSELVVDVRDVTDERFLGEGCPLRRSAPGRDRSDRTNVAPGRKLSVRLGLPRTPSPDQPSRPKIAASVSDGALPMVGPLPRGGSDEREGGFVDKFDWARS
jgi:hypothetical protein